MCNMSSLLQHIKRLFDGNARFGEMHFAAEPLAHFFAVGKLKRVVVFDERNNFPACHVLLRQLDNTADVLREEGILPEEHHTKGKTNDT